VDDPMPFVHESVEWFADVLRSRRQGS